MSTSSSDRPAAVLVAVQLPEVDDETHAADLAELRRLVNTLGFEVIATVSQRLRALAPAAVLGEGKLKELAELTGGTGRTSLVIPHKSKARSRRQAEETEAAAPEPGEAGDSGDAGDPDASAATSLVAGARKATVVVVDHDITPSQARNLERATSAQVLDRTGVIVEIFHRHAQSREARLQVEIARLTYVAPRLRETGGGGDRQRGGIGGKGAGESALELDRRRIRDRIAELRRDLAAVQKEQERRRAHRHGQRRVALVGYTNAGKSSLMRALTGSQVLVVDKLFATLDTTVRALHPEVRPRILISDTVGFIQKLPHDLVASFRSTLDEALEASLLLYVADASDPTFRHQLSVTRTVLGEIGAGEVPHLLVLNKIDRLDPEARAALRGEFSDAIHMSARDPVDVAALRERIIAFFEAAMVEDDLLVPYAKQNLLGEVYESARVLAEAYDDAGARLHVRGHPTALARLKSLF
jgi:GTP-binding protein HflX